MSDSDSIKDLMQKSMEEAKNEGADEKKRHDGAVKSLSIKLLIAIAVIILFINSSIFNDMVLKNIPGSIGDSGRPVFFGEVIKAGMGVLLVVLVATLIDHDII